MSPKKEDTDNKENNKKDREIEDGDIVKTDTTMKQSPIDIFEVDASKKEDEKDLKEQKENNQQNKQDD